MDAQYHVPVLRDETLELLVMGQEKTYVDATVGGGGHAEGICERLHGRGRLICFDADSDAVAYARERLERFADRVTVVHSNFRNLKAELQSLQVTEISGLLLDLGVSSFQLDEATKGFSHRFDAPIDMRIDRRQMLTGLDVVNTYSEQDLADVLYKFGEERRSRRIAKIIVGARPAQTTGDLRDAIESAVGKRHLSETLARVFQAIRIEVNGELKNLERVLHDALDVLSPGGRVVVISYHSLEDRIVKDFFRRESQEKIPSGSEYVPDRPAFPRMKVLTKKPIKAKVEEVERNPRARSAKMRAAERL